MKSKLYGLRFLVYAFAALMAAGSLVACSESDGEEDEYANWQERNDNYWTTLYANAKQRIAAGDTSWRIYPLWALTDSTATNDADHIVVQVLESGSGTESPISTDTVVIHYSGRLIPTAEHPDGYNFEKSWSGTFSSTTALPVKFAANGGIDGFITALQLMHRGDHWIVYIPYEAAYGSDKSASSAFPPYSNLVFDIRLVDFFHHGEYYPPIR